MIADATNTLHALPLWAAGLCALAWNVAIFAVCLAGGQLAIRVLQRHRVAPLPPPVTAIEVTLALSCVTLNALVSVAGMVLWRANVISLRGDAPARVLVDALVLFFAMDVGMYMLHRVAHQPLVFALVHQTHHNYENPRPLTFFVLNPLEVLGFGGLWLLLITMYHASPLGIVIYLTLNVIFGLVGHLGVEPLPAAWLRLPVLRYITTSTFHAEHHRERDRNYGFYTALLDRLCGTLSPNYERDFFRAAAGGELVESH